MSDEVLEEYIRQTIEAHCIPEVTFAWQGGEPTIWAGIFLKRLCSFVSTFVSEDNVNYRHFHIPRIRIIAMNFSSLNS
jgi:sulfatase maturation enzyme AslB (radical SAM superfamily)